MSYFNVISKSVLQEIKYHLPFYLLLTAILSLALFIRVYRAEDLLGFYYDQGRDALVIWRFWYNRDFFLIGPVTGLMGIYLGPFYYLLIAPLYLIGGGSPVYSAVFLSFLSVIALFILYLLGQEMHSKAGGLIAATIGGFSFYIFTHSRWLSNPNPILLTSVILLYAMWKIVANRDASKRIVPGPENLQLGRWLIVALTVGLSLQLEAASAVFYIPSVLVFVIWIYWSDFKYKRYLQNLLRSKTFILALSTFFITFIPQIVFNFLHENILFENLYKLFIDERAFRGFGKFVFEERLKFFFALPNKFFIGQSLKTLVFTSFVLSTFIVRRKYLKVGMLKFFSIFLIIPMLCYLLFQGNFGNIYDYYLSGYFLPFILLFSIGLAELAHTKVGRFVVLIFLYQFIKLNAPYIGRYLSADEPHERPIVLEDQLKGVGWVFGDVKDRGNFNVDVYVPPVIPYSYDYLFLWQGRKKCGRDLCGQVDEKVPLLYALYEEDPPHPERLQAWLERQKGIAMVEKEEKFGQITVQRRKR